jgi:hypothetical protein
MASSGYGYRNLGEDADANYRRNQLSGKPWFFYNNFPFAITLYVGNRARIIGTIQPKQELKTNRTLSGNILEGNEIITCFTSDKKEFIDPFVLRDDSRSVMLGAVGLQQEYSSLRVADKSIVGGLYLHNHISMPVDVYYKAGPRGFGANPSPSESTEAVRSTILIARIAPAGPYPGPADNARSYFGGGISQTYTDRDRNGFHYGDLLTFVVNGLPYTTTVITDSYSTNIHIGVVIQKELSDVPDSVFYRTDLPNVVDPSLYVRPMLGTKSANIAYSFDSKEWRSPLAYSSTKTYPHQLSYY